MGSSRSFLLVFHSQSLLRLHELSNTHWDTGEQIIILTLCCPVGLATPAVVVHTVARRINLLSGSRAHVHCPFLGSPLGPGFLDPSSPILHFVAEVIPNAVNTATHAAVVRFVGPGWNGHSIDGLPHRLWRCLTRIVARLAAWSCKTCAEHNCHFILWCLHFGRRRGLRLLLTLRGSRSCCRRTSLIKRASIQNQFVIS